MITYERFMQIVKTLDIKYLSTPWTKTENNHIVYESKSGQFSYYGSICRGSQDALVLEPEEVFSNARYCERLELELNHILLHYFLKHIEKNYKEEFKRKGEEWLFNGSFKEIWLTDDEMVIKDILEQEK